MPSLTKRPTSKYWVACFTSHDGRQLKRSTETTDRKLALRIANEFEAAYRKRRTEDQVRRVLFDIHEDITGQSLNTATVGEFFNQWSQASKATTSPRTHAKYAGVVRQFLSHLGNLVKGDLSTIAVAHVAAFRDNLASRLSVGTANIALKIVRAALAEAVRQSLLVTNPAALVKVLNKRPADSEQRRPFTLPELKRILKEADDEWQGIILTGLYSGQRLGDVARLTWQNLDLERGELRLVTRKTGRRQIIPLAAPLQRYFEDLDGSDDPKAPLFPNASAKLATARNGESGALSNTFRDILESAGLVTARPKDHSKRGHGRSSRRNVSELSLHCLRHTATSLLKNAGVSDVVARDIVGHDSVAISRQYTHIETETLRRAIELMPDVLPSKRRGAKK